MTETHTFNWLQFTPATPRSTDIKVEPSYLEPSFSLISPPCSPSLIQTVPEPPSSTADLPSPPFRRRTSGHPTSPKRPRPYPSLNRDRTRVAESKMNESSYETWSSTNSPRVGTRPNLSAERRSSEIGQPPYNGEFNPTQHDLSGRSQWPGPRPPSTSSTLTTSSLTGAIGEAQVFPSQAFSAIPTAGSYIEYQEYNPPASPESVFTSSSYNESFAFQNRQGGPTQYGNGPLPMGTNSTSSTASSSPIPSQERLEQEVHQLRKKLREFEVANEASRQRVRELQAELANDGPYSQRVGLSGSSYAMGGLPSPLSTPSPQAAALFQVSWKARTDARIRQFCSLNRAGNALCAWHDSRRERRAFPPRMAPAGHLNCGCTYEEALFEESLARHGVGSYHPGESVRMDPALRNPLLKLLQTRYGYKDGDFEREPTSGEWMEGEGPSVWEQRAHSGASSRKVRADNDRR